MKRQKVVYLLYTRSQALARQLLAIYSKSHYQAAYDRLADIAERHGQMVLPGDGNVAAQTHSSVGQVWWLERHEVL